MTEPKPLRPDSQNTDGVAGLPVSFGVAFAPSAAASSSPVSAESGQLREGTDAVQPSRTTSRRRVRDLRVVAEQLGQRDWAILHSVARWRFLTTDQIVRLHFHEHSLSSAPVIARRVLARLRRHRVLGALQRPIGGKHAGSAHLVHYLDVIGDRLLREGNMRERRHRFYEPSTTFLRHLLAIAETHTGLVSAERQGTLQLVRSDNEPHCWRSYNGIGGQPVTVKPDLYLETAPSPQSPFLDTWFIEIDRGTEHLPTLLRKSRDYHDYYQSGVEQSRDGSFPLVVWLMAARTRQRAQQRCEHLLAAIAADRTLNPNLFRVIEPEQLLPLIQKGAAL